MAKIFGIILFGIIAISIYGGMHYYVYHRISRGLELPKNARLYLRIFFIIFSFSFIAAQITSRAMPSYWVYLIGMIWLGLLAIGVSAFIIKDILALFLPKYPKVLTLGALAVTILISGYSIWNAMLRPCAIKRLTIPIKKLPAEMNGMKIVHITDTHFDILTQPDFVESIVKRINSLKPDIILITGDITDIDVFRFKGYLDALSKLSATHGVWAVAGNHEYYMRFDIFENMCAEAGINILANSNAEIDSNFFVVGLVDDESGRFHNMPPDIDAAMEDVDTTKPVIMMYHRPRRFKKAVEMGVDLQLAGHTHAGQIPPIDLIVWLIYKYHYGLFKYRDSYIYTSSGAGTWGPPMRTFSRNEIALIELVKE